MTNPEEEMPSEGKEALHKLKETDPPQFLSKSPLLSLTSRKASEYLYSLLKPYSSKSYLDTLLTDGFDPEQIWQQVDIMSKPLVSKLEREFGKFERDPDEIRALFDVGLGGFGDGDVEMDELSDDDEEEDEEVEVRERSGEEEEEGESDGSEDEGEEEGESEEEEEEDDGDGVPEVEDGFLKIKELQKFLDREEEREYGGEEGNKMKKRKRGRDDDEEDEDEDEEDESDEDDDELLLYGGVDEDRSKDDITYKDFFENKKGPLSTHEKERAKIKEQIKEMEEANLGPKDWTMMGEVTATKRPKDSALEVDLDFEHNARPPPVITEEVTASLEDIIKKRILEGNFDDVQKVSKLPTTAPKEFKELDDNKSKKGLAELYEDEYRHESGLAAKPMSHNDELRTEASKLFKTLCLKLDALSHFHFAPKPVVEDMSVQANVPALAMEEIAPVAVSDAAMLAPEEVFTGKGDIKDETELTKEDRRRRRAKKKRMFKAIDAKKPLKRHTEKVSETPAAGKGQ